MPSVSEGAAGWQSSPSVQPDAANQHLSCFAGHPDIPTKNRAQKRRGWCARFSEEAGGSWCGARCGSVVGAAAPKGVHSCRQRRRPLVAIVMADEERQAMGSVVSSSRSRAAMCRVWTRYAECGSMDLVGFLWTNSLPRTQNKATIEVFAKHHGEGSDWESTTYCPSIRLVTRSSFAFIKQRRIAIFVFRGVPGEFCPMKDSSFACSIFP